MDPQTTALTIRDFLVPMISGSFAFAGVLLGLVVGSRNVSRQIRTNYDLQSTHNQFTANQRRKDILRQKAEDVLDKLIKIDELKYKAHVIEFRLSDDVDKLIDRYQEARFELSRFIFSVLGLIDMYFPELKESESFKQGDIVMIQGSIANLVMSLKHYGDLVNNRLLVPPVDTGRAKIELAAQINNSYSQMQNYLTKSELVELSKELRGLLSKEFL